MAVSLGLCLRESPSWKGDHFSLGPCGLQPDLSPLTPPPPPPPFRSVVLPGNPPGQISGCKVPSQALPCSARVQALSCIPGAAAPPLSRLQTVLGAPGKAGPRHCARDGKISICRSEPRSPLRAHLEAPRSTRRLRASPDPLLSPIQGHCHPQSKTCHFQARKRKSSVAGVEPLGREAKVMDCQTPGVCARSTGGWGVGRWRLSWGRSSKISEPANGRFWFPYANITAKLLVKTQVVISFH